ncbi:hypothetical protein Lal_00037881 [Lupinus albus]|nr:hypothetical protein Lal_00037881 [Lupinus albus]
MPTDENLQTRGCQLASMCNNCQSQNETSSHLFLTGTFVTKLWDWLGKLFNICLNTVSIESILLVCNGQWSPQVKGVLVAAIINTINTVWLCINLKRFDNKKMNLVQAKSRILVATSLAGNNSKLLTNNAVSNFVILREFKVKQNFQKAPRVKEVVWLAPQVGWIKIKTDGVAHGSPGLAGGGCIFRDCTWNYLGGFAAFFGIKDSLFAEIQAAIMALEIANQKGWKDIWLECDSALVVDLFNGKGVVPWRLVNSWHRCLHWISLMRFRVTHIFREGNTCADRLASFGVSSKMFTLWDAIPRFIFEEFNRNRLGLPNYRCNFL